MIEPTDEQIAAFKAAWEAEDERTRGARLAGSSYIEDGSRTRAGLRAALNVGP